MTKVLPNVLFACTAAGLLGAVTLPQAAQADVVHMTTSAYSTIYSGSTYGNNTNGGGPTFFCGGGPQASVPVTGWHDRALIKFDIASLVPAGATITDVQLTLTMAFAAGSGGGSGGGQGTNSSYFNMGLHVVTSDWGQDTESLSTYSAGGGTGGGTTPTSGEHGATWNEAFYDQTSWVNPDGGGDFVGTTSATQAIGDASNTAYTWTSEQLVDDVQAWLDGSADNFGWILVSESEMVNKSFRCFWSSEGALRQMALDTPGAETWAPDLQITYTMQPVPEPATAALMAVAAGVMILRRKGER